MDVRDRTRFESQLLPGTEGAESPFFSPDGRWVAFFAEGQLKKVSLEGGAPVTLGPIHAARGHAWLQDDGIVVTQANNVGLSRIPARGGGSRQPFTSLAAGQMSHRWPRQLPDGSAVLFSAWNDVGFEGSRIAAQRAGSTEPARHDDASRDQGGYVRGCVESRRKMGCVCGRRANQ